MPSEGETFRERLGETLAVNDLGVRTLARRMADRAGGTVEGHRRYLRRLLEGKHEPSEAKAMEIEAALADVVVAGYLVSVVQPRRGSDDPDQLLDRIDGDLAELIAIGGLDERAVRRVAARVGELRRLVERRGKPQSNAS